MYVCMRAWVCVYVCGWDSGCALECIWPCECAPVWTSRQRPQDVHNMSMVLLYTFLLCVSVISLWIHIAVKVGVTLVFMSVGVTNAVNSSFISGRGSWCRYMIL